ncbi:glycoside hydrolase family 18 protein [Serpula lacrymans var. lacrymans S7.3]|uniref:chitinase n=1 Tax=Serpula lacrymans var. lacrymans (strain S7.3) TaxID=936435 RepID=F8QBN0_SERL3|nr:glycoside hydrolase family 18 protein [Serpula lacrymans var. lacrymans S7.3]
MVLAQVLFALSGVSVLLKLAVLPALAFDMSLNNNLAVYWGQNSYGAVNPDDTAGYQQPISYYCQDDTINAFPVAFLDEFFAEGGLPSLDLANTCNVNDNPVFAGTQLPNCSFLASDIEYCQAAGKIVTLSLGGATGGGGFSNDTQAQEFAQTIWDLFLGGSSTTRPFGAAVLDGVDLDIEGGSQTGYAAFVTAIRTLAESASKEYYVTAAPQCPYPDAYIGTTLDEVGFDAVYVQFYNNYCGLNEYSNANDWDFGTWDNWATTVSPNSNVKVYIGAPASSTAAGSGYVDASTITTIIQQTMAEYSSFGGVMLWDASQAYANNRYDISVKDALTGGTVAPTTTTSSASSTTTTTTTTTTTSATTSTTATAGTGDCASIAAWSSGVAYTGGDQVTYDGSLWTAKWWTENDEPGGSADDWTDDGACTSAATAQAPQGTVVPDAAVTPVAASPTAKASGAPEGSAVPKATSAPANVLENATTPANGAAAALEPGAAKATRINSRFFRFM